MHSIARGKAGADNRSATQALGGRLCRTCTYARCSAPRSALRKAVVLAAGVLVVIAGVIALPLPGPGLAIMALGAVLVAEESLAAARALDWLELKLRRLFASARPRPRRRGIL